MYYFCFNLLLYIGLINNKCKMNKIIFINARGIVVDVVIPDSNSNFLMVSTHKKKKVFFFQVYYFVGYY